MLLVTPLPLRRHSTATIVTASSGDESSDAAAVAVGGEANDGDASSSDADAAAASASASASSSSSAAPPEINNMGEWVEARKQWELDNVGNPLDVGAPDTTEWVAYVAMAVGSFALGLFMKGQGGGGAPM
jgi:hypothetical protein